MNNVLRSPLPVHGSVPCVSACDTRANGVGWAEADVHQHWVRRSTFQHTTREGTHLSEDDAAASSPADTLYDGMDAYLHVAPAVGESIIAIVCPADGGGTALAPECDAVVKLPGCRSISPIKNASRRGANSNSSWARAAVARTRVHTRSLRRFQDRRG